MGEGEGSRKKTGWARTGAAFIWGGAQALIAWYTDQGFFASVGSFFGGAVTGWTVAALLRWVAMFGAGYRAMVAAGVLLGIAVASGAVIGLNVILTLLNPDRFEIQWDELFVFLVSWSAIVAAVLGAVTGLYVRSRFPAPEKPEGESARG